MKKTYEKPLYEEMLIVSESIMSDSGEEEDIVDSQQSDNEVAVFALLKNLFNN